MNKQEDRLYSICEEAALQYLANVAEAVDDGTFSHNDAINRVLVSTITRVMMLESKLDALYDALGATVASKAMDDKAKH